MPSVVVRMLAPFVVELAQLKTELGRLRDVSGEHAREVLGLEYTSAEDSIEATARSLVEKGGVRF
jgi:hypothetical protein